MHKLLKISAYVFIALLAITGLGAWYASSYVNPTKLTKLLSATVFEATGRQLTISGSVSLSVFPAIIVKAEQVSLSNASWASNPNMVTLREIELDIRLLPLLKGKVEIGAIHLQGLEAYLQKNQAGEGNWNLVQLPVNVGNLQSSPPTASDTSTDNPFVVISKLDIQDARIQYQEDKKAAKVFIIPKLSIEGGDSEAMILLESQYVNDKLGLKGKISSLRNTYFAWNQSPVKSDLDLVLTLNGKSLAITGQIEKQPQALPQFNLTLNSKSFDLVPLAGSAVVAGAASSPPEKIAHQAQDKYFFSDKALPFNALPSADGIVNINIDQLGLPHQAPFTNLKTTLEFKKNRIDANTVSFNIGRGNANLQLSIAELNTPVPKVSTKGMAKGFSVEQILATTSSRSGVSGGDAQLAWNLKGSGLSLHQLVSRANGAMQLSVGSATVDSQFLNKGGDFVITLLNTINPLYKKTNQTVLECAVFYLPINNGAINIQDSAGIETDRLNLLLSGTLNLGTEALNIVINPKEKSGLTTGLDLAGLIKIEGTLQNPTTAINKTGVVNSAVNIGLGFLTGGISIAAENAKSLTTKSQPCKTALHPWSDIYSVSK